MSNGVPYFYWREGRPRWEPGPSLRAKGNVGTDLKSDEGEWLELDAALLKAKKINERAGVTERVKKPLAPSPPRPATPKSGFIYFMRSGEAIKIGWAKNPGTRMKQMLTGNPLGFSAIVAVRALPEDEKKLHRQWQSYRIHGEWFRAEPAVLALMERFSQQACQPADFHPLVGSSDA